MQIFAHYDVLCKNSLMTCANVHVYIKQKREKKNTNTCIFVFLLSE